MTEISAINGSPIIWSNELQGWYFTSNGERVSDNVPRWTDNGDCIASDENCKTACEPCSPPHRLLVDRVGDLEKKTDYLNECVDKLFEWFNKQFQENDEFRMEIGR